jgi:ribosomal protein L18
VLYLHLGLRTRTIGPRELYIPSNRHLHWLQFNGTATKPRLSVFCSNRQLYAVLADDHNKKILFYGSTLQKSICGDPPCTTAVGKPSCSSSEIYNPAGILI